MLGFDIACQRREARMPAYFVVELDTKNMDAMAEYRAAVPGTLAQYGGRFLVRGGATERVEGEPEPKRIVISNSPMPPRSSVGTTRRSTRRYCRAGSRMRAAAPLSSRAPDRAHPQRYALDRERQRGCRRK